MLTMWHAKANSESKNAHLKLLLDLQVRYHRQNLDKEITTRSEQIHQTEDQNSLIN
jgi:hypothetical protein